MMTSFDTKISNECSIFKDMLDKESEEWKLEADNIRSENQTLKHDIEHQAISLQNDLTTIKQDLHSTKEQGFEELKQLIEEEKEERQKEAELIHDNLTCKVTVCLSLSPKMI